MRIQLDNLPSNRQNMYLLTRYLGPLISPVCVLTFVQVIRAQVANEVSFVVNR